MDEELADSGSEIDMDAAMESIAEDLFPPKEEPKEEYDVVEEIVEEVVEEPVSDEPVSDETIAAKEEVEDTPPDHPAPQSWKKEMHEFWKGLDPAVQNYVEQRETQMKEGLEKDRGDATLGRDMRDIMSPYSEMLRGQGVDEKVLFRNLLNAHARLSSADPAGKAELLNQLAQSYNIPTKDEEQADVDPALKAVQAKVNSLEQHLNASHQQARQEANARVEQEVEAFASDPKHEHFDEVSPQMVPLIHAGYTLEEAYDSALRVNPVTSQTLIDKKVDEALEKAREEWKSQGEKSRKAKAPNVRGRDTKIAPTEPLGTMEDTMREVFRDIQTRSN